MMFTKLGTAAAALLIFYGLFSLYYIYAHQYPFSDLEFDNVDAAARYAGASGMADDVGEAINRILLGIGLGVLTDISRNGLFAKAPLVRGASSPDR